MASRKATIKDTPALCLVFGVIFAFCSAAFGLAWRLDIAQPDALIRVEGQVKAIEYTNRAKAGPKTHLYVESPNRVHHITQDTFPQLVEALNRLTAGDSVVVLVKSDPLWRDLEWLWGLRRNGEDLLSYDQILALKRRDGKSKRPVAYSALGLSILLFVTGFALRKHFGAWGAT